MLEWTLVGSPSKLLQPNTTSQRMIDCRKILATEAFDRFSFLGTETNCTKRVPHPLHNLKLRLLNSPPPPQNILREKKFFGRFGTNQISDNFGNLRPPQKATNPSR